MKQQHSITESVEMPVEQVEQTEFYQKHYQAAIEQGFSHTIARAGAIAKFRAMYHDPDDNTNDAEGKWHFGA